MHALSRIRTVAIALLLPLTAAFAVTGAPPAQAVPEPAPVKTLLTDMDGDGTYDTVKLFDLGSDRYQLTVMTTKGSGAGLAFTSQLGVDMDASQVLYGAATLDGVKGSEVMVNLFVRDVSGYVTTPVAMAVYTWRPGGSFPLVAEKAPAATFLKGWHMGRTSGEHAQGYRFFSSHGRRYVDVSDLKWKGKKFVGKATRSVWRKGAWRKVSTRHLTVKQPFLSPYLGYGGDPVLLGVTSTDIDGVGAADELRYYRYVDDGNGSGRYKVKVTTATGKVVTRKLAVGGESDPLIGAAALDGVPGRELIFEVNPDDPNWRVFTWRSGRLVDEPAPALCGDPAGGTWHGCSDETPDNFTFYDVNGARYALFGTYNGDDPAPYAKYDESVWQSGAWVKVRSYTDTNPGTFQRGFIGIDIVKP